MCKKNVLFFFFHAKNDIKENKNKIKTRNDCRQGQNIKNPKKQILGLRSYDYMYIYIICICLHDYHIMVFELFWFRGWHLTYEWIQHTIFHTQNVLSRDCMRIIMTTTTIIGKLLCFDVDSSVNTFRDGMLLITHAQERQRERESERVTQLQRVLIVYVCVCVFVMQTFRSTG